MFMENKEIKRFEELKEEELQNELSDEEMEKVAGGGNWMTEFLEWLKNG